MTENNKGESVSSDYPTAIDKQTALAICRPLSVPPHLIFVIDQPSALTINQPEPVLLIIHLSLTNDLSER